MLRVVATADQVRLLAQTNDSVEIVDANGKRLGTVVRPPSEEDVRLAKQRIDAGGKRYATEEVVSHMRSLGQE